MSDGFIQLPTRVEEFFREHRVGRRRFLALTYEFDPAAFERTFENVLRQNIIVDVVAGTECIGATSRARFWRANWPRTFHPKLICLLAGGRVCVGVGSANLTSTGMRESLEAWTWFEDDVSALAGVRRLLEGLEKRGIFPTRMQAEEFVHSLPNHSSCSVISSLDGPLIEQVVSRVGGRAARIDIVSPLNGDPCSLIKEFRRRSGSAEIHLFTDPPPPVVRGVTVFHSLMRPDIDDAESGHRAVALMHAKLYAFHHGRIVHLFWGSANLSYSAWQARLEKPNVELLVHTRMRSDRWAWFRDKALPPGHRWIRCEPKGKPLPAALEKAVSSWSLLHAVVDRGQLQLEASHAGRAVLDIRADEKSSRITVDLAFADGIATLTQKQAAKLGCDRQRAPRWLEWRVHGRTAWKKIPVNRVDGANDDAPPLDLAEQLYWEYSGRRLPRPSNGPDTLQLAELPDSAGSPDEERELTECEHQGELDRFVLEWRLVARNIAQAAGGHKELAASHRRAVLKRILEERDRLPEQWPEYRIRFVQELLHRPWPA